MPQWLRVRDAGVEVRVRLTPRAPVSRARGVYGDRLKIQLTEPPVGGEANRALERFIAKAARVARSKVNVVVGTRSRSKTVLVECDDGHGLAARLVAVLAPS